MRKSECEGRRTETKSRIVRKEIENDRVNTKKKEERGGIECVYDWAEFWFTRIAYPDHRHLHTHTRSQWKLWVFRNCKIHTNLEAKTNIFTSFIGSFFHAQELSLEFYFQLSFSFFVIIISPCTRADQLFFLYRFNCK